MNKFFVKVLSFLLVSVVSFGYFGVAQISAQAIITDPDDLDRLVVQNRPNIHDLVNEQCIIVDISENTDLETLERNFCLILEGAGFGVSSDGYMFSTKSITGVMNDALLQEFLLDENGAQVYTEMYSSEVEALSDEEKDQLVLDILESDQVYADSLVQLREFLTNGVFSIEIETTSVFMIAGNVALDIAENGVIENRDDLVPAEVIAISDSPESSDNVEQVSENLSLLKVDLENFPSLGNFKNEGEFDTGYVIDEDGNLVETAISLDEENGVYIFDEEIERVGVGSPLFSPQGILLGVYNEVRIIDEDGSEVDVDYATDINRVIDLSIDNEVTLDVSSTSTEWNAALELFWAGEYESAIEEFESVLGLYPEHQLADDYLEAAQVEVNTSDEEDGDILEPSEEESILPFDLPISDEDLFLYGGIGLGVLFLIILILFIRSRMSRGKKTSDEIPPIPPADSLNQKPQVQSRQLGKSSSQDDDIAKASRPVSPTGSQQSNNNQSQQQNQTNQVVNRDAQTSQNASAQIHDETAREQSNAVKSTNPQAGNVKNAQNMQTQQAKYQQSSQSQEGSAQGQSLSDTNSKKQTMQSSNQYINNKGQQNQTNQGTQSVQQGASQAQSGGQPTNDMNNNMSNVDNTNDQNQSSKSNFSTQQQPQTSTDQINQNQPNETNSVQSTTQQQDQTSSQVSPNISNSQVKSTNPVNNQKTDADSSGSQPSTQESSVGQNQPLQPATEGATNTQSEGMGIQNNQNQVTQKINQTEQDKVKESVPTKNMPENTNVQTTSDNIQAQNMDKGEEAGVSTQTSSVEGEGKTNVSDQNDQFKNAVGSGTSSTQSTGANSLTAKNPASPANDTSQTVSKSNMQSKTLTGATKEANMQGGGNSPSMTSQSNQSQPVNSATNNVSGAASAQTKPPQNNNITDTKKEREKAKSVDTSDLPEWLQPVD